MVEVLESRSRLQLSLCWVKPSDGVYLQGTVVDPLHMLVTSWTPYRSRRAAGNSSGKEEIRMQQKREMSSRQMGLTGH